MEQSTSTIVQEETHPISNNIVAVFVVQFDVHKGNVIEWQHPPEFDLKGVEYQAICSGLHRIEHDIM
ncbi:hypothetical protein MBANPS3_008067 [Mucor bainieri]